MIPTMYCGLIFAILLAFSSVYGSGLTIGYYDDKCPGVEKTIANAVAHAIAGKKGLCAGVLRLHFHDCFVRGCDGSVLLNSDAINPNAEKSAPPNLSLRGFEVIDAAKTAAEQTCAKPSCAKTGCPPVVSCADVLAFAARDCVKILGDFYYNVYAGRLDGKVSVAQEALDNLPAPFFDMAQLENSFAKKNLSLEDLTILSGGHSVGVSHCSSFKDRLNPVNSNEINVEYAKSLKRQCTSDSVTIPQDHVTVDNLDNQYYKNNMNNTVLFFSDWVLRTNTITQKYMTLFADDPLNIIWKEKFKHAMQKMGQIIELSADQGEIRKICNAVNAY